MDYAIILGWLALVAAICLIADRKARRNHVPVLKTSQVGFSVKYGCRDRTQPLYKEALWAIHGEEVVAAAKRLHSQKL